jgi:hypothetical protein
MTLANGMCHCNYPWQSECTEKPELRGLVMFLNIFIQLYIVGVMVLYLLRTRLPVSYRIYNWLGGLSLLIYTEAFYKSSEVEMSLNGLVISHGPYFDEPLKYIVELQHILPTVTLVAVMAVSIGVLYVPLERFNYRYPSFFDYLKN